MSRDIERSQDAALWRDVSKFMVEYTCKGTGGADTIAFEHHVTKRDSAMSVSIIREHVVLRIIGRRLKAGAEESDRMTDGHIGNPGTHT